MSLKPNGVVSGWIDTADWLEWEFTVAEGGVFRVEVTTASGEHSRPWQGGHDVQIAVGERALDVRLALDRPVDDVSARYYPQGVSVCGEVQIPAGGTHRLSLKAVRMPKVEHPGLNVRSVKLVPVVA